MQHYHEAFADNSINAEGDSSQKIKTTLKSAFKIHITWIQPATSLYPVNTIFFLSL